MVWRLPTTLTNDPDTAAISAVSVCEAVARIRVWGTAMVILNPLTGQLVEIPAPKPRADH
jgi:hypothetical protein